MVMRRQLQYSNRNRKLLRRLWDLCTCQHTPHLPLMTVHAYGLVRDLEHTSYAILYMQMTQTNLVDWT